jgi:hypothetical protein
MPPKIRIFGSLVKNIGKTDQEVIRGLGEPVSYSFGDRNEHDHLCLTFVNDATKSLGHQEIIGYFSKTKPSVLQGVFFNNEGGPLRFSDLLKALGIGYPNVRYFSTDSKSDVEAMFQLPSGTYVRAMARADDETDRYQHYIPETASFFYGRDFKTKDPRKLFEKLSIVSVAVGDDILVPMGPYAPPSQMPSEPVDVPSEWISLNPAESVLPSSASEGSDVVGTWIWVANQILTFNPDGTCATNMGLRGTWRKYERAKKYRTIWTPGTPDDAVTVSADGQTITEQTPDGRTLNGHRLRPDETPRPHAPTMAGTWRWSDGKLVTILTSGICRADNQDIGYWTDWEYRTGAFNLDMFSRGRCSLTVSSDGKSLIGKDENGKAITATRVQER